MFYHVFAAASSSVLVAGALQPIAITVPYEAERFVQPEPVRRLPFRWGGPGGKVSDSESDDACDEPPDPTTPTSSNGT